MPQPKARTWRQGGREFKLPPSPSQDPSWGLTWDRPSQAFAPQLKWRAGCLTIPQPGAGTLRWEGEGFNPPSQASMGTQPQCALGDSPCQGFVPPQTESEEYGHALARDSQVEVGREGV